MIIYYEPNGIIKMEVEENKQILACDIPQNLTDLYFGRLFNKIIKEGTLPITLRKIVFGEKYNQELYQNIFPDNLKYLQFMVVLRDLKLVVDFFVFSCLLGLL